ncbi:MAG: glycosyltransferase family 2 protein [Acidobacteria bacterium]|nr:glycosyltransferase family 2 protein [Acidobacteriota bacterium]MCA1610051.1 glycosyltransferase family 2 protein [Acidobacteriota bacterium]
MPRQTLTAIVPTLNEEINIRECLETLGFADEILVVDSGSTDRTVTIAAAAPRVRVLAHEYLGNGPQCNWAMDQASHPWVLIIDADERVPGELAHEITGLLKAEGGPAADQYVLRRDNVFLGRVIRHSGWGSDRLVRFVRRGTARYPERRVHADMEATGRAPTLATPLVHYTFRSFSAYLEKLHRYAVWGAADLYRSGRSAGFLTIAFRSGWRFLRTYVFQGGFLDGSPGLVLCALQAYGTFLKWARLWEWRRFEKMGWPVQLPGVSGPGNGKGEMGSEEATWG